MADPVKSAASTAASGAPPLARPRPDPYVPRHRFGLAYLILAGLVGAAVGLTIVFATSSTHRHATAATWSTWQPDATGTLGVREIARHVAPEYRLENRQQIVAVVAGPMELANASGPIPVSALLVSSGVAGVPQARIDVAFPHAGVFYQLRGTGPNSTIAGTATAARGEEIFREVVELALYTFHYLPQTDHVIAFLPPPAGVQPTDPLFARVIYLPRAALSRQLQSPLSATISPKSPITPETLSKQEGNAFSSFAEQHLYHYDFRQAADNSALLVLTPIEP